MSFVYFLFVYYVSFIYYLAASTFHCSHEPHAIVWICMVPATSFPVLTPKEKGRPGPPGSRHRRSRHSLLPDFVRTLLLGELSMLNVGALQISAKGRTNGFFPVLLGCQLLNLDLFMQLYGVYADEAEVTENGMCCECVLSILVWFCWHISFSFGTLQNIAEISEFWSVMIVEEWNFLGFWTKWEVICHHQRSAECDANVKSNYRFFFVTSLLGTCTS